MSGSGVQRYLIVHEYVGQAFYGWQRQPDGFKTVQSVLEKAISEFIGAETIVMGSSRTDTGVHALGNTCHVDLERRPRKDKIAREGDDSPSPSPSPRTPYSCHDVRKAINARIMANGNEAVRVTKVLTVDSEFHARFKAKRRTYFYRIACGSETQMSLFHSGFTWSVRQDLDISLMRQAAQVLIGTHDFSTFRTSKCQSNTPVKVRAKAPTRRVPRQLFLHPPNPR